MSYPLKRLQIMLVEADPVKQLYIELLLKDIPCNFIFAKTGEDAVRKFNSNIDGILMDIGLPGIDGYQAAEIIHQKHPYHTAIVYAYAYSDSILNTKFCSAKTGIEGLIKKPYLKNDLKDFMFQVNQKNSSHGKSMPLN
ncbi:MAG: response regulator [Gammaproteobacteria bacterium]|nr:response regulator [Gammaproteobacteria bacterium]